MERSLAINAARKLAGQGLSVIPLRENGKRPIEESWRHRQSKTTTLTDLARWPACNVGIVTGAASGLVVVDFESRESANWFAANVARPTVAAYTPRGVHAYFAHPGTPVCNRKGVKHGGCEYDVRGDGGYVVAPPSEVVADGKDVKVSGRYAWLLGMEIRDPREMRVFDPRWVPTSKSGTPFEKDRLIRDGYAYICRVHATSGEGGHNATYRVANRLRDSGMSEGEALLAMQEWNKTNAHPPWTDRELLHKVRCAYQGD